MKIAVSATGQDLESLLNPRFGRCEYFIIVETDDMSYQAIRNDNAELSSGAGIQSASLVAAQGVGAVLTGQCGPKAAQAFAATDIQVHTGYSGTVRQAVEQFKTSGGKPSNANGAADINQPVSPGASTGIQRMTGRGGRCGGGGGGGGRGMGMGMGMGRCRSTDFDAPARPALQSQTDDLSALKTQARQLKDQLAQIEKQINDLDN